MAADGEGIGTLRADPPRRRRIIEAALRVVADHGVSALTFRAVADAASVSLGSITHYFAEKDDLLEAVVRISMERNLETTRALVDEAVPRLGLSGGVCALIEELTVRRHRTLVVEYELYIASLRHPLLRQEVQQWWTGYVDVFLPHADRVTAENLSYFLDGVLLRSALCDDMLFADDVEPHVTALLAGRA